MHAQEPGTLIKQAGDVLRSSMHNTLIPHAGVLFLKYNFTAGECNGPVDVTDLATLAVQPRLHQQPSQPVASVPQMQPDRGTHAHLKSQPETSCICQREATQRVLPKQAELNG